MQKHLFLGKGQPPEYTEMLLVERFGIGVLDLPDDKVRSWLTMWEMESKHQKQAGKRR